MTESLAYPGDTRRLSVGEEVLNAVSHGVGALLAVAGTVLLVLRAKAYGGLVNLVGVTVFGVSMILLYLFSCLYHALPPSKGKQVFQVLDHCSIFLLIMGTYAPVCLVTVGGPYGWTLFGINLACGLVGIALNAVDLARWKKLSLVLYLVMGWMAVLAMPVMLHNLSRIGFLLILLGGLPTPLGVVFYRQKGTKAFTATAIWHFLCVGPARCSISLRYTPTAVFKGLRSPQTR